MSILTLPCDNGTWGVAFVTSARDKELRALREVAAWEAALALFPGVAHWGAAEPLTSVQVIAAIEDRHRRFVVDGHPIVTGLVPVGDAYRNGSPNRHAHRRAGRAGPAGQGDLPRLDRAPLPRPRPQPGRTPSRPRLAALA